ncbi:MAG: hypothetical protein K6G54_04000 [Oscillospiraceae bacterium]|nr:hypothetical protein [Oscillospiraceae bacterium]
MGEVRLTLRRLAPYYLLLAVNIIPCAGVIPLVFPVRNVSAFYLLVLSACLVRYYSYRMSRPGRLSLLMKLLSWMALLLILLRGVKYSAFMGVGVLARHTWYLYYVPMLLLPLFFFYVSLLVAPESERRHAGLRVWSAVISAGFILLVLTNDLHRLVFRFRPHFADWDHDYTYGWLFYLLTLWQYVLYLAAVLILCFKCRISSSRRNAWLTALPFTLGIVMSLLLNTGYMPKLNGMYVIEFPEALILMVAGVLECCMQLGLIPTNRGYGKLFQSLPLAAQITDRTGRVIYASRSAAALSPAQIAAPDGTRLGAHSVLHRMEVPGGYAFWQDDLSELDRLNEALAEAKDSLSQEAELIRLQNRLKEKRTKIEQRTAVYDTIARRTQRQSRTISHLAETALASDDAQLRRRCGARIVLLGAYIKRYANLMLLSDGSKTVAAGELGLSMAEVLRYLQFSGVPCELINTAACSVPADAALAAFEAFATLLDDNFSVLRGVFVNLRDGDGLVCRLTLEHPVSLRSALTRTLARAAVRSECTVEDDVVYLSLTLPKGGDAP